MFQVLKTKLFQLARIVEIFWNKEELFKQECVWFGYVLWHINLCGIFNDKSCLYL